MKNLKTIAIIGGSFAAVYLLGVSRSNVAKASKTKHITYPDKNWKELDELATYGEEVSGIPGIRDYLLVTMWHESRGKTNAKNSKDPALDLFLYDWNYDGRYKDNPYRFTPKSNPKNKEYWGASIGLTQMMPASALTHKSLRNKNPDILLDPIQHIPIAINHVVNLYNGKKNKQNLTYGDIRSGWASPTLLESDYSHPTKAKVLNNLENAIDNTNELGLDVNENLIDIIVDIDEYPGYDYVQEKFNERFTKN